VTFWIKKIESGIEINIEIANTMFRLLDDSGLLGSDGKLSNNPIASKISPIIA
jgi:hypothetical protein